MVDKERGGIMGSAYWDFFSLFDCGELNEWPVATLGIERLKLLRMELWRIEYY